MPEPRRNPASHRAARAGSLSPRRSGALRNPRTTTTVVGRSAERGQILPFPRAVDPSLAGANAARVDRTAMALQIGRAHV